jgi:hypothetical protein
MAISGAGMSLSTIAFGAQRAEAHADDSRCKDQQGHWEFGPGGAATLQRVSPSGVILNTSWGHHYVLFEASPAYSDGRDWGAASIGYYYNEGAYQSLLNTYFNQSAGFWTVQADPRWHRAHVENTLGGPWTIKWYTKCAAK